MIDDKDQMILDVLSVSGREPASSISEKTGISVPTVIDRIKKLQESGVIRGYSANIDTKKIGLDVSAIITIISESSGKYRLFIERAKKEKDIEKCFTTTGNGSHVLIVNTKNTTVFNQPFRAEMLSVYLIREFSVDLVEHVAKQINPRKAIKLDREIKQHLGIGNSTGLGMAPFIIKHPKLINKWMSQYTKTLNNIVNYNVESIVFEKYKTLLNKALNYIEEVITSDEFQINKNKSTINDLRKYILYCKELNFSEDLKWLDILDYCDLNLNNDTQEIARVQLIELFPQISEELAEDMADDEVMDIDGSQSIGDLKKIIDNKYSWVKNIDFNNKNSNYLFWYVSAA